MRINSVTEHTQQEAMRFLLALGGGRSEIISTHISTVVLKDERAYKLKREVVFPYLDFSTPQKRFAMCEREVALNRRTAPKLYLGVRRITREAGGELVFDGVGELVDAVVEMRRFDKDALFDRLAAFGALTAAMIEALAERIAKFHDQAAVDYKRGGYASMKGLVDLSESSPLARSKLIGAEELASLATKLEEAASRHGTLLDRRRNAGKVRRCHGDLILRNICLLDGEPTPFDCLEFSDDLATIDVLYDLAFLLMDLWRRDQHCFANLALNRYLDHRDETDGLPLLPYFMALRATIRADIAATRVLQADGGGAEAGDEARAYFKLASSLIVPSAAQIIAIGGLSGSGKSSVAERLAPLIAPAPGARTINSDRIRKKLFGVATTQRLPQSAYTSRMSEQVYELMCDEARNVAICGWPVIVDAVFDRPEDRATIEAVAQEKQAPFHGFWLDADADQLLERVNSRRRDVSDATREVLIAQLGHDRGDIAWSRIDASRDLHAVVADIAARLRSA
jgi:aminoglycoside phosphotransferase family enzyme/predicted kinase